MTSTVPDEESALGARVAELEAALAAESEAVRDQQALYRIAALAN